ncbi:transporter [Planctomycetota bacterium]|nr:transporter [Planctomycetota bacterium]
MSVASATVPDPNASQQSTFRQLLIGTACAAGFSLLFSCKGTLAKAFIFPLGVDATVLVTWRMLFAAPCFALIAWHLGRSPSDGSREPITRRDLLTIAAWGLLGYHLSSWLDFEGLMRIGAGLERTLLFLYPSLVVVWIHLRDRRMPTRSLVAAVTVTYLGVVLAWSGHAAIGTADVVGVLFVLASATCFAGFLVGTEPLVRRFGGRVLPIAMIGSTIGMIVQCLFTRPVAALAVPGEALAWIAVLSIACTVVPVQLQSMAQQRLGLPRMAVVTTIGPVATLILAWALLGEHPGLIGWIGSLITVAGAAWAGLAKR